MHIYLSTYVICLNITLGFGIYAYMYMCIPLYGYFVEFAGIFMLRFWSQEMASVSVVYYLGVYIYFYMYLPLY